MGSEFDTCPRAQELFRASLGAVHERTDALFARLLVAQWGAAVACALWVAPRVVRPDEGSAHPHIVGSVLLGGFIAVVAVAMTRFCRGTALTRHMVAAA